MIADSKSIQILCVSSYPRILGRIASINRVTHVFFDPKYGILEGRLGTTRTNLGTMLVRAIYDPLPDLSPIIRTLAAIQQPPLPSKWILG